MSNDGIHHRSTDDAESSAHLRRVPMLSEETNFRFTIRQIFGIFGSLILIMGTLCSMYYGLASQLQEIRWQIKNAPTREEFQSWADELRVSNPHLNVPTIPHRPDQ